MRGLRTSIAAITAVIFAAAAPLAMAANAAYVNIPLDTVQATVNVAIANINNAHSPAGSGSVASAINIPTVASSVNLVNIQGGATGVVPNVSVGGPSADTNVGLAVNGAGTGGVYLSGTTAANAAAAVLHGTTNVNQIVLTGTNTGTVPSITVGGSGADANRNLNVAGIGTGIVTLGQAICTVTGSTPQTCNGQRGIVTTGTLVTAAVTDASFVINNSSVTTSSLVQCTDQGYSGTLVTNGEPVITTCVPGTGTITVHITNVHASNALNGTVQIGFAVLN